jgi:hypothetical protein
MAFLKKYLVWIILALILAAEGGVTFMLLGRKGEAAQQEADLQGKEKQLASLKPWEPAAPKLRADYTRIAANLTGQLNNSVIYFWHRDQGLEALFPDKDLADFRSRITPWTARTRIGGLDRSTFQNVYNTHADELVERAEAIYIDRHGLGLASNTALSQSHVTAGDIFKAQKEFWIVKTVVDTALEAEVTQLAPLKVGQDLSRRRGRPPIPGTEGEAKPGKLVKPIELDLVVRCPYPRLGVFIQKLQQADILCRVKTLMLVERGRLAKNLTGAASTRGRDVRPMEGMPPEMEGMPPGMSPEAAMEGMVPRRPVAPRAPAMPEGMGIPPEMMPPGAGRPGAVPGVGVTPGETALPEVEVVEANLLCQVSDFTLDIYKATFTGSAVNTKDKVKRWLQTAHATSRGYQKAVWGAILDRLPVAADVQESGDTVTATLRPDQHFDPAQSFPVTLEARDTKVELEFRLVTFEPEYSEEGVAKAERIR